MRALLVVLLVGAVPLAACGQSAEDEAKAKVCDARADIDKQVRYLQGLTLATATSNGVRDSLKAIGDDLRKVSDAQERLRADMKQQVRSANKAFQSELDSVMNEVGRSVSLSDAQARLRSALQRLGDSYRQTFAPVSCA